MKKYLLLVVLFALAGCTSRSNANIAECYSACDNLQTVCGTEIAGETGECNTWCDENFADLHTGDQGVAVQECFECLETDAECNSSYVQEFCYKPCKDVFFE